MSLVTPQTAIPASLLEAEASKIPHSSRETLKASIRAAWANMSKDYIIKTYKVFQPLLEAMIEAEGGHIVGQTVNDCT